ncbi:hypothetical protein [Endozoicomonas sp. SESOKO2]|uniref:hypothetical protein n=1 Tax=Endozoicomonas sp. SESOKO2 TaxID=2828743 RepID=UPI002149935C|nr:hypothetical protein [Endozoicomonas sp. SESOKO2]
MDQLPPYQGQSPKPNSVEASTLDDTAMSQGNAYGKTVSLFRGGPSGVSQAGFTPDPAARQKDQKETGISSRAVAFGVSAYEAAERKPKLDFADVNSVGFIYWQEIFKSETHPGKKSDLSSRPDECRDICDISEDSIVGLINYHKYMVKPKDRLAGDVVTYAPLLSSEFDEVRSFLEDDLNLDPKDTVIIDAGSGPFCYHSALFAVAGFTVRPYDYSPARSLYCKEDHGVAEKNLSPFLKVNDKDLTSDDITPSFFDKNSVLFMSFPDLPGHPISLPLVKKYTESEALNKVVVLLVGIDDEHECNFGSVSKETMDFLKENYDLRCNCPTRGVLLQSSLAQIYVKRGVNRADFTSGPVTRKNTNIAKDRMRKAFMELEKQSFGHAEELFRELLSEDPLQLNDSECQNIFIGLESSLKEQTHEKKMQASFILEKLRLITIDSLNKFGASTIPRLDLALSLCEQVLGRYCVAEARLLALRNKEPDANESAQCEPSGNFDFDQAQVKVWKLMHKYELAEKLQQNMIGKLPGDSESNPSQSADNDRPE